jgi:uncharacterized protein YkwD
MMGFVQPSAIVGLFAAAAVALILVAPRPHSDRDPCGPVNSTTAEIGVEAARAATFCLINRERTDRGLQPLAQNALLAQLAREHSEDMVRRGYFEHTTPEGVTVQDRMRNAGYGEGRDASGGENIEWGIGRETTPAEMVAGWMASRGHRADILRPAFTEIGIGIAQGAPTEAGPRAAEGATYTTDFGGVHDPTLQTG